MVVDLLHIFNRIVFVEFYSRLEAMQEFEFANFQAYKGALNGMKLVQRNLLNTKGNVLLLCKFGVILL